MSNTQCSTVLVLSQQRHHTLAFGNLVVGGATVHWQVVSEGQVKEGSPNYWRSGQVKRSWIFTVNVLVLLWNWCLFGTVTQLTNTGYSHRWLVPTYRYRAIYTNISIPLLYYIYYITLLFLPLCKDLQLFSFCFGFILPSYIIAL